MGKKFIGKYIVILVGLNLTFLNLTAYGNQSVKTQPISDVVVTSSLKVKYMQDPLLSAFDIHIETNHGIVNLSGLVDTNIQYERAIILAENTDGVTSINSSNLKTKSSDRPISDTVITAKIKGLLVKNKLVNDETEANPWPIHVETTNGIVFISGKVANNSQKNEVIKTAKLVEGVKSVRSDLKIDNK